MLFQKSLQPKNIKLLGNSMNYLNLLQKDILLSLQKKGGFINNLMVNLSISLKRKLELLIG